MSRFCHLSEGHPDFANLLSGGVAPRFCQILIIKKTEITQIRLKNTHRGVITKINDEGDGGTQILPILGGADRFCQSSISPTKIEKPPPPSNIF